MAIDDIGTCMRIRARLLTVLALGLAISCGAVSDAVAQGAQPLTVIELFTSQGCSSCPPADALLRVYAQRPGVMALSLAVDYWDHLGWKDTLASPKHSARQRTYAKALGTGNVYTPQVVIDGTLQAIGSDKAEIEKALVQLRASPDRPQVALLASSDGKRMAIDVGEAAAAKDKGLSATVWLALVAPRVEVQIKQGENRGRTIAYHNVVRELSAVGMWSGKPTRIELPTGAVMDASGRGVVLLQADNGGRILAATWVGQ